MHRIWTAIMFLAAVGGALSAQSTSGAGDVKLENQYLRVLEYTMAPHQRMGPREHPMNRVLVFRNAGELTITEGAKPETLRFQAGEARWNPAGPAYLSENLTDHAIDVVEIELKDTAPHPPAVLTSLDPPVADAEHYKIVFENDQVRVLHVQYPPHEKGGMHQHVRDRLVVNLSPELRAKYGDVRMIGPETHKEENATEETVERFAIEVK